ncbi:MAG: hypothetical protein RLZZ232_3298, partial [Planctomycetota bacterium]
MSFQDSDQQSRHLVRASRQLIGDIETLIAEAQAETRPLEVEPYRGRLFACFVQAWQQQLIPDDTAAPAF